MPTLEKTAYSQKKLRRSSYLHTILRNCSPKTLLCQEKVFVNSTFADYTDDDSMKRDQ